MEDEAERKLPMSGLPIRSADRWARLLAPIFVLEAARKVLRSVMSDWALLKSVC